MPEVIVVNQADVGAVRIDASMELWRLVDGGQCPALDFVITALHGRHGRRVNRRSHKLYFVLAGTLVLKTDRATYTLGHEDIAIVPPGIWCELYGTKARVAIACAPAFDPNDEELASDA